jgi:hypothetical protein
LVHELSPQRWARGKPTFRKSGSAGSVSKRHKNIETTPCGRQEPDYGSRATKARFDAAMFGFGVFVGAIGTLVGVCGGFILVPVIAPFAPQPSVPGYGQPRIVVSGASSNMVARRT